MAAIDTTCFDGVVGLANCACPCLSDVAPEGYNEATSGLYIADILPVDMADGADDCNDPDNPWNVLERGLSEGKNMLVKDLNAGLMKRNQLTRQPFNGLIGEKVNRDTVTLSKAYAGMRIWSPTIKGGYLRINKIGGVFNASGTVTVRVYDQFNVQIGSPVAITVTAGTYSTANTSFVLPLWQDGGIDTQYFLTYQTSGTPAPRAVRAWCTTCNGVSVPLFSTTRPWTTTNKWSRNLQWANWLQVGGFQADNLTSFDLLADQPGADSVSNGLAMEVELTCDPVSAVCLSGLDYSDPVSLSIAHALRYAAAICTAEKIIRRTTPYRNAQVAREILAQDIQQWWKDYQTNVEYATFHANVGNTDCVFCKPAFSMGVQSKLV